MRVMQYAGASIRGGLIDHVVTLIRGLRSLGHDVHTVLSPAPAVDGAARACALSGARVARLTVTGKTDLVGLWRLRRLVAHEHPDVFHLHLSSPIEAIPALMAACWGGARRLVTTEHAPTWFPLRHAFSRSTKKMVGRWLDGVIALSDADACFLEEEFGVARDLLIVIPNGVESHAESISREKARSSLGLSVAPDRLLGCAAALEEKKGLLDLLGAVQSLDLNGWGLLLAGEGSLKDELGARAKRSSVPVFFTGHLPGLDAFLAAIDIFAFPSHQEAMPLALLEAMTVGLPIVASSVGGIPEALEGGRAGILVEPSRPEQLAKAVKRLASEPDLARRLGTRAKQRAAARYSAARMVQKVSSLYRSLHSGGIERTA